VWSPLCSRYSIEPHRGQAMIPPYSQVQAAPTPDEELTLATAAPGPPGEEMHTREGALREPDVCFSPREEAPGPSCARSARNVNLYWAVLPASRRAQRSPCPDAPGRGPHRLATNQPVRRSHIGTERSQRPGSPNEASSYGRPRRRPSALWSALSA